MEVPARASEPFMLGVDLSWIPQQEDEGRCFSVGGTNTEIFSLMRTNGFNWVRLRLFHTPTNEYGYSKKGYCDLPHTIAAAQRAKAAGFKFLLDFHYSDNWADPGKQFRPRAWRDLDDAALVMAVGHYTRDSLMAFQAANVLPDMVQIGNEISNGFLWREGETNHLADWTAFGRRLRAGVAAVRAVDPSICTMIHLDCGGSNGKCVYIFDRLAREQVKFDVIGLSYYPKWHGTVDQLKANLVDLAGRYPQPIVVVEYSTPTIREVNDLVHALPTGKGMGTFIWEPTGWPHGDTHALFEKDGRAKPELQLYPEMARAFGVR